MSIVLFKKKTFPSSKCNIQLIKKRFLNKVRTYYCQEILNKTKKYHSLQKLLS